jgi:hypothetical protein
VSIGGVSIAISIDRWVSIDGSSCSLWASEGGWDGKTRVNSNALWLSLSFTLSEGVSSSSTITIGRSIRRGMVTITICIIAIVVVGIGLVAIVVAIELCISSDSCSKAEEGNLKMELSEAQRILESIFFIWFGGFFNLKIFSYKTSTILPCKASHSDQNGNVKLKVFDFDYWSALEVIKWTSKDDCCKKGLL